MKSLIVLIIVFAISCGATLLKFGHVDALSSGRIAMAVMLLLPVSGILNLPKV